MSFNANTIYKAVDIDSIAKQCKDSINDDSKCFVVTDWFGSIYGVYRCRDAANQKADELNFSNEDDYWNVSSYDLL